MFDWRDLNKLGVYTFVFELQGGGTIFVAAD
jgi:hypothetical protein